MTRFQEVADGYLDTKTSLVWSREIQGPMTWQKAMDSAVAPWRLPTIEELTSIIDYARGHPATELPSMISDNHWSSSSYAYYVNSAWSVYFDNGAVNYGGEDDFNHVRCVRPGP